MNEPTGYTALDMVGYTDKGVYSSATSYVKNDLVKYGGGIWRCKVDDTTNVTPAEGVNWTLWVGEPTNLMEAIIAPIENSPADAAHTVGDQLIWNDVLYKVVAPIAIGDTLTVNTNIVAARKIVYQISGLESDVADIEPTTTASKAYAVGDYLFCDWDLYRVITAITQGDTITASGANPNVVAVTVGEELAAIRSSIPAAVAVKGNAEQNYRTGNVNLTYENLGTNQLMTGGTGATSAAGARTNLGLGSAAVEDVAANLSENGEGLTKSKTVFGVMERRRNIAPIEDGTTSVGHYYVGDYIERHGTLYRVKQEIQPGVGFTVDTNIEEKVLADELSKLNQSLAVKSVTLTPFEQSVFVLSATPTLSRSGNVLSFVYDGKISNTNVPANWVIVYQAAATFTDGDYISSYVSRTGDVLVVRAIGRYIQLYTQTTGEHRYDITLTFLA